MPFIGNKPTALPLSSNDLEDNIISTAKIQDNAVTAAKYIEPIPFRNIIINGDMSIHQRGSNGTSNNSFGVDRFKYNDSNNFDQRGFTVGQVTDVPSGQGFSNSQKFTVTTTETTIDADEYSRISQFIEAQNLQYLKFGTSSAESLTLSFWVKSSVTGTYAVTLYEDDDARIIGSTYTISSADTWEKKTITFSGDTTGVIDNNNGIGLVVNWYLSAGSNFTSSDNTSWSSSSNAKLAYGHSASILSTASATWQITGVQLEAGTTASDFEFLPVDVNLKRCQRYYQKTYNQGVNPGTATDVGATWESGTSDNGGNVSILVQTKGSMRSTPTTAGYARDGTSGSWYRRSNSNDGNATVSFHMAGENSVSGYASIGSNWVAGLVAGHVTFDSEL